MKSVSLGRDMFNLTISKITASITTMVSAILLSRFCSLSEYGTYNEILLVVQLAISIFTLGLPNSINFFLAKTDSLQEKRYFLSNYYTINTFLCLIMGIVLFTATPLIVKYFNNEYIKNFAYILAILPWTIVIVSSIENILVVYNNTLKLIIFRITNSLCIFSIITASIFFKLDFDTYMMMYLVVQGLYAISVYLIVNRIAGRVTIAFEKKIIKQIFQFSIPLGLASMVSTISIELDKMLVGIYFSTDQLAIYSNASKEIPVTIIAASFTAVLMPQLVKLLKYKKNNEAIKLWGETTILSYIFICFFVSVLFVFSPEIITILYSEKYLAGVSTFRIYSVVLLLRVTYFGMILNSIGKTKLIFYSSVASLFLNVILNFLFLYLFGISGLALATFLSVFTVNMVQLMFTARYLKISLKRIFPWRYLGIISMLNILLGILFYCFQLWLPLELLIGSIPETIFLGFIWLVLYIITLFKPAKRLWILINENKVE